MFTLKAAPGLQRPNAARGCSLERSRRSLISGLSLSTNQGTVSRGGSGLQVEDFVRGDLTADEG